MLLETSNSAPVVSVIFPANGGENEIPLFLSRQTVAHLAEFIPLSGEKAPAALLNETFKKTAADFVCLITDAVSFDDTFLEKCLWYLDANPRRAWVTARIRAVGDTSPLSTAYESAAALDGDLTVPAFVIRKSAHDGVGGFSAEVPVDVILWDYRLSLLARGSYGGLIDEPLLSFSNDGAPVSAKDEASAKPPQDLIEYLNAQREISRNPNNIELMKRRHRKAFKGEYPPEPADESVRYADLSDNFPFPAPPEAKETTGVLWLFPWMVMGGADRFNLDLVRLLPEDSFHQVIATTVPSPNPWHDRFSAICPRIYHLPAFLPMADWLRFLKYLIARYNISLVFIGGAEFGYVSLPLLKEAYQDVVFVDYLHMEEMKWKAGGHPRMSGIVDEFLDLTMVTSEYLKSLCGITFNKDPGRIKVVYIGTDAQGAFNPELFPPGKMRAESGIGNEEFVILYIGRLDPQKRPLFLVDIIEKFSRENDMFRVWVIGGGPDEQEMKKKIRAKNLEKFFVFWGPQKNTAQFYREGDVLLLPSDNEGIALVVYEAMAMNVPVISAEVGGHAEVIGPDTGFLVPRGKDELDEYARILGLLATDRAIREKTGMNARARIMENFTTEKMLEGILSGFRDALNIRRHSAIPGTLFLMAEERYRLYLEKEEIWKTLLHEIEQRRAHEARFSEYLSFPEGFIMDSIKKTFKCLWENPETLDRTLERLKRKKNRAFLDILDKAGRNAPKISEEEAMEIANEAIQEVRKEKKSRGK